MLLTDSWSHRCHRQVTGPYIKRARKYGSPVLQAPMDYPPDWMLVNVNSNQDVDKKYFDALAHYYLG